MREIVLVLALFVSFMSFAQDDVEVDGITIKKTIKVRDSGGKTKLLLSGFGILEIKCG